MTADETRDAQSGVEAVLAGVHPVIGAETPRQGAGQTLPELHLLCLTCGWMGASEYPDHLAAALAPVIAAERAKALREAADQCDRDAEDGHCGSATCAENNRVTARWLRDRADREQP